MSWLCALRSCAIQQVDLDVGLVGAVPQEVMPHQPVEVVRTRGAGIDLVVLHFRLLAQVLPQFLGHARGLLQRGAVGHVDDHLELALVVEGQHLHFDQLECHQRAGEQAAAPPRRREIASAGADSRSADS